MDTGLVVRDPPVVVPEVVPVTLSVKSPRVVAGAVATPRVVVVGDAELDGKATEAASVVVALLAVLSANAMVLGSPMVVDPAVRLTATVYDVEQPRSTVWSAGEMDTL